MKTYPEKLIQNLREARHVAVITGAGISAESGIPTFRDALTGIWVNHDPLKLASPAGFLEDPELVWSWYAARREQVRRCLPNAGHRALAAMAEQVPRFTLITQNVDGLHQAAGSRNVIELHGNIQRVRCFDNGHIVDEWNSSETPPRCPQCNSPLRPDVVWFGEMLPERALAEATTAASECDVFLSIGTSAQVHPAAELALHALTAGATVVEINAEPTPLTPRAHYALSGRAGEHLPALAREVWQITS